MMSDHERRITAAQGYYELGLPEEARAELAALPPEIRQRCDVIEMVVLCLMNGQHWEEALEEARRLCAAEPMEPGGYIHAAYCLHELGRTREALDLLAYGPASLREKSVYFYNMGCYHARLGNTGEALNYLRMAFERDQDLRHSAKRDPDLAALAAQLENL